MSSSKDIITISSSINAPTEDVGKKLLTQHTMLTGISIQMNHSPSDTNTLVEGGTFKSRMEAKDISIEFDFAGT